MTAIQRRPRVLFGFLEFDDKHTPRVSVPVSVALEHQKHNWHAIIDQNDQQTGDFVIARYSKTRTAYMVRLPFVERKPQKDRASFDRQCFIEYDETKTIASVFQHFYDVFRSPLTADIRFNVTLLPNDPFIVERWGRLPSDWYCVHVSFCGEDYSDTSLWGLCVGLNSADRDNLRSIKEYQNISDFRYWWMLNRCAYVDMKRGFIDPRNKQHSNTIMNAVVLQGALALHSVFIPYILLWILDWLPWVRCVPEYARMKLINGVYASCKRIQDAKQQLLVK